MLICVCAFPETTFRAPAVVPPTTFAVAPTETRIPSVRFGTGEPPAASRPTQLPETTFCFVPASWTQTPRLFPEMTLRAPADEPPTVFALAPPLTMTPNVCPPAAAPPVVSVPIQLPSTTFVFVPDPSRRTPAVPFPEITFRAPAVVPPTTFAVAPPEIAMPSSSFPFPAAPFASRPTQLPSTTFADVPAPKIDTPKLFAAITLREAALVPPIRFPVAPPETKTPVPLLPVPVPVSVVPPTMLFAEAFSTRTPSPLPDDPATRGWPSQSAAIVFPSPSASRIPVPKP